MVMKLLKLPNVKSFRTKYSRSSLEAMTKAQLLNIASSENVEGLNDKTLKADIISAILDVK